MSRLPPTFVLACLPAVTIAAVAAPLSVQVLDAAGKPVAGAVVGVLVRGAHTATTSATAQIEQRKRVFAPEVNAVQTGTSVQFPNFDTVRHHVYSFSPIKRFELKLYAGTPAAPVVFDKPGVAVLGCNIHDRMTAWVIVMDTPLVARTGADGVASFDVPAGEHLLQGWSPSFPDDAPFAERTLAQPAAGQRLAWTMKPGAA
jgi:plastocyanin